MKPIPPVLRPGGTESISVSSTCSPGTAVAGILETFGTNSMPGLWNVVRGELRLMELFWNSRD